MSHHTVILRKVVRQSFTSFSKNSCFTQGSSVKTTLSPEHGRTTVRMIPITGEEGDHGHGSAHAPPSPVKQCYKSVFLHQKYVSTRLSAPVTSAERPRRYSTSAHSDKPKIAVVLSGSGVHDGSEIHESVSILVHLSRAGVEARCFAPDVKQADVINHVKGATSDETRNVLVESARIARGKIKPLSQLKIDNYSAIIFPGGYGAAKNLSTFAKEGENCSVQVDVEKVLKEFHAAKKPIGLCCVSPVIAAKVIPGVKVTVGNEDKDINEVIKRMGARAEPVGVMEVVIDEENVVISTPAYMCNAPVHKVYDGIGKLVDTVLLLVKKAENK